jgi:hypothetical protein
VTFAVARDRTRVYRVHRKSRADQCDYQKVLVGLDRDGSLFADARVVRDEFQQTSESCCTRVDSTTRNDNPSIVY